MKNKTGVLACLVILLMAVGCGEVVFRKVDCQAFSLTDFIYAFFRRRHLHVLQQKGLPLRSAC